MSKLNCGDRIDRISELPGNVIDCILQHMNIRDLIRTTILSRKWRYMWSSVPRLEFDEQFYDLLENLNDSSSEIPRIITKILSLHNGPIVEFILCLAWNSKHKITFKYLNKWISFLSKKGVKHIKLRNYEEFLIQIPSHLFSCHGLTHFQLDTFNLSIPSSFRGFKTLLHLHLEDVTFELGALDTLLSGCPILEKLVVLNCSGYECIDLSSSSPALIDLTLSLPHRAFGLNKIQRLSLVVLGNMLLLHTYNFPLSRLIMSLKYLRLDGMNLEEREELLYLVSVLKSASNLVELDILTYVDNDYKTRVPDLSEKLECSSSSLSQLQTANIIVGTSSKHVMSLARFILANSPTLKTLTFYLYFQADAPIMSSIWRELLWMERASQRARVKFVHR